jgi:hypothetical protein
MPKRPAEALLLDIFGLPFLSYVCAVDEGVMRVRLEEAADLPAQAEAVFQGLVPVAEARH